MLAKYRVNIVVLKYFVKTNNYNNYYNCFLQIICIMTLCCFKKNELCISIIVNLYNHIII